MSVLDYEPPGFAIAMVALTPLHLVGSAIVSHELFRLSGGITTAGPVTFYGGIDYAWTNVAWLPGGVLCALGRDGLGLVFFLAGSIWAAYLCASVVAGLFRRPRSYGRFGWRLWACLLAWLGWIPVPVKMTLTYWHTVAY